MTENEIAGGKNRNTSSCPTRDGKTTDTRKNLRTDNRQHREEPQRKTTQRHLGQVLRRSAGNQHKTAQKASPRTGSLRSAGENVNLNGAPPRTSSPQPRTSSHLGQVLSTCPATQNAPPHNDRFPLAPFADLPPGRRPRRLSWPQVLAGGAHYK